MMNYLDDYIGVTALDKTQSQYLSLINLFRHVGLPVNEKKLEPPGTKITCLGILIDIKAGTIAIPEQQMLELKRLCKNWLGRKLVSKRQIQSLIGKLIYLHRCVRPTRLFINRMLPVLRNSPKTGQFKLPPAFYKDLKWFDRFLDHF